MAETEVVAELVADPRVIRPDVGVAIKVWSQPDRVMIGAVGESSERYRVTILPEEAQKLSQCLVKGSGDVEVRSAINGTKLQIAASKRRVLVTFDPIGYPDAVADFRPHMAVPFNNALVEHAIAAGWQEPVPEPPKALPAPREPEAAPTWGQRLRGLLSL